MRAIRNQLLYGIAERLDALASGVDYRQP